MSDGTPTSIVQDTLLRPMLNDHGQRPYAIIYLDIKVDHSRVLERSNIVDVHITRELQLGVPDFYYPNLRCGYTDNTFHTI
jgi:hypothetical protein